MIKKVGGTVLTRFIMLLGAFLTLVLNTNALGDSGLGTLALISLSIISILAISNYVGGGAVIYLVPRLGAHRLILPAYLWTLGICLFIFLFFSIIPIFETKYLVIICILACLHGWFTFHMQILVGQEKIKQYNFLQILQVWGLTALVFFFYQLWGNKVVESYLNALLISFSVVWFISFLLVFRSFKGASIEGMKSTYKQIFALTKYGQTANVLQILNYRLNYLLMEKLLPGSKIQVRGNIGDFSIGMYMSEAIWNVSKSLSLVQYARISNVENRTYQTRLTTSFFKISIGITLIMVIVLLLIPEFIYTGIFGDSFAGIKEIMWWMSPGILVNSGSVILSHYFSGVGEYRYNTISSGIGLIGTLIFGFLLLSSLELVGASLTFSTAMLAQFIYLLYAYIKYTKLKFHQLLPKRYDLDLVLNKLRKK